jgi:hypothetical protein
MLDKQEGVGDDDSVTVTYNAAIPALPTVTKPGYELVGWTIDGEFIDNETVWTYTENKTAVAHWSKQTYTVTFNVEGLTLPGTTAEYNATVTAPTVAGYDITWDFDFETPITGSIEITGTKALKGFALKATSAMYTDKTGNVEVEYNDDGEFGIITATGCNVVGAKLKFDLTAEDIAVFKSLGYTHITYMLNCGVSYPAGSNSFVSVLHGKRNIDIVLNEWNKIVISLDEFEEYFTSGEGVFVQNGWVAYSASLRIKDISLAKLATVTYKDGDDVINTVVVEKCETITAMSMPGYDVVWMNGDTEFDFATEINEDITLTAGTKSLKQIKLTADSVITTADGDTALTLDAEGGLGAKVNTSSSGGYSFKLNWKFDLTAEDIEAFKTMGYTHFTFKLYVWSSAKDFTTFTILNKTKTVDVVEGAYTDVTITLDELSTYVTSGNGNFHSSTWLMYYQGEARIKDMALVMGAN